MNGLAIRPPATLISVCSGVGGLDLGLHAAIPGLEPVVYLERDAFAASVLVARMEEAALPRAPIWDDVCTFDARQLVGLVDLVAGGTPCQDLSLAGKRRGLHGERSRLFFEHVRIASECRAPFFFWENVGGATRAVPAVAEHLASHGYTRAVWCVVRASDVGAPHQRARVFLLAHSNGQGQRQPSGPVGEGGRRVGDVCLGVGQAHPNKQRLEERGALRGDGSQECATAGGGGVGVGASGLGRSHHSGRTPDMECIRGVLGPFPPGPGETDGWQQALEHRPDLAPATAQSRLRGLAHGLGAGVDVCLCPREDRLRAAGNGVVPQQAALAWRVLWAELERRMMAPSP